MIELGGLAFNNFFDSHKIEKGNIVSIRVSGDSSGDKGVTDF